MHGMWPIGGCRLETFRTAGWCLNPNLMRGRGVVAQMHGHNKTVRVAQKAGNWTSVTWVMGSSPTLGRHFSCHVYFIIWMF